MKKTLLTAVCTALLAFGAINVNAQPVDAANDAKPRHEMKMKDMLTDKLNLTEEQREAAAKIREDGRKKMEPLMQEQKELREKMDNLRKENMAEFEKILTPEQQEKFKALKDEHKNKKGPHKGFKKGRHGPKPEVQSAAKTAAAE